MRGIQLKKIFTVYVTWNVDIPLINLLLRQSCDCLSMTTYNMND